MSAALAAFAAISATKPMLPNNNFFMTRFPQTGEAKRSVPAVADNAQIAGIIKASLSDIKQNSFVGVTAMPQPDGSLNAVEVHIFPESMRGTGEGHYPGDLRPQSTMTNANVEQIVSASMVGR